jgi:hypothetical protein
LKPGTRGLFETIEGFVKSTYVSRSLGVNETGGLLAVDNFVEMTMKKGVFDIKLVDRPGVRESKREDDANGGGWFNDRTKSLIEVDSRLLRKPADHPAGLMTS